MKDEPKKSKSGSIITKNMTLGEISSSDEEGGCFERARAWLSDMIKSGDERFDPQQLAEAHYYLFVACMRLDKKKESRQALDQLKKFVDTSEDSLVQKRAQFWVERATEIWEHVISRESSAFNL